MYSLEKYFLCCNRKLEELLDRQLGKWKDKADAGLKLADAVLYSERFEDVLWRSEYDVIRMVDNGIKNYVLNITKGGNQPR